jgi:outer membrane protein
MTTRILTTSLCFILQWVIITPTFGQNNNWTVQKCIAYALQKNIQIQKTFLTTESNKVIFEATKASRFPLVDGSAQQNFDWADEYSTGSNSYNFNGSNNTSFSVTSSITIYAGLRLQQSIKQSEISYKAGEFDSETMKEAISLNIMDVFLQILYAEELVKNTQNQIDVSNKQVELANERLNLGVISKSDLLQAKSQLAIEKQTIANAQGLLTTNKVTLMQLMELPVTNDFEIEQPDLTNLINKSRNSLPDSVYQIALAIKPEIKGAALHRESISIGVDIARSYYMPHIALNAGVGTGFNSTNSFSYSSQFSHGFNPYIGLSLSIPIYHNQQISSTVEIAKINTRNAVFDEQNTKNVLRKAIETACTNVFTAQNEFDASKEQLLAAQESYSVAAEKYTQEVMNAVDLLIQKTNSNTAESNYLQAKYNLIFSYKTLDFYLGIPFNF